MLDFLDGSQSAPSPSIVAAAEEKVTTIFSYFYMSYTKQTSLRIKKKLLKTNMEYKYHPLFLPGYPRDVDFATSPLQLEANNFTNNPAGRPSASVAAFHLSLSLKAQAVEYTRKANFVFDELRGAPAKFPCTSLLCDLGQHATPLVDLQKAHFVFGNHPPSKRHRIQL